MSTISIYVPGWEIQESGEVLKVGSTTEWQLGLDPSSDSIGITLLKDERRWLFTDRRFAGDSASGGPGLKAGPLYAYWMGEAPLQQVSDSIYLSGWLVGTRNLVPSDFPRITGRVMRLQSHIRLAGADGHVADELRETDESPVFLYSTGTFLTAQPTQPRASGVVVKMSELVVSMPETAEGISD